MSSATTTQPRSIAVITGTRAEFGLLRSLMHAIAAHSHLHLRVMVTGTHLLPPHNTIDEIKAEFKVAAIIPMQHARCTGRFADAEALGRGIEGFTKAFAQRPPDVALVLGDRIEAFAAAAAASVAGIRVAHMHGGDRAEGVADELMRHAITKLSHIHLPATQQSAMRIVAMGEEPDRVHVVGSPAIDGLREIVPMNDVDFAALGSPQIIVLLHPQGDDDEVECERALNLLNIAQDAGCTLALHPNHDAGRNGIMRAIQDSKCRTVAHLPRERFIGLLRRVRVVVGNSSAGLIECSAIPVRVINIGRRQAGREVPANVVDIPQWDYQTIEAAISRSLHELPLTVEKVTHPFGDGQTGRRTAALLGTIDLEAHSIRKRNTY